MERDDEKYMKMALQEAEAADYDGTFGQLRIPWSLFGNILSSYNSTVVFHRVCPEPVPRTL